MICIVNWADLLINVSNDLEFLKEVLGDLENEMLEFQENFQIALEEANYIKLSSVSHKLKGSLDYLCCDECKKKIVRINNFAKECVIKKGITKSELDIMKTLYLDYEKTADALRNEIIYFFLKQQSA